jgi:CRP/FNR family nitrogen fixation transcriptional regulator
MPLTVVESRDRNSGPAGPDILETLGARIDFDRNAEIFAQDERADFVYRVVRGVVRTARLSDDGRRQVGGFHQAGDLIGLEDGERRLFAAEALTDCTVLAIRRRSLEAAAERNGSVARLLWTAGTRRLREMQDHLVQVGRKSALERVATVLSSFAEHQGCDEVVLAMSRQDIADYLNLTIETVSRMLSQLKADNVISLVGLRRMRVCDPAALQRLAA